MNEHIPDPQMRELLQKLSENTVRLGESISALTMAHNSLEVRVRALEAKEQSNEIIRAREDERDKALYDRLKRMEDHIKGIKGVGTQALWIIAGTVLTAVVVFLLKGGLN